ncbi:DNA polymerase III subunit gamma and tau [Cryobacterium sp. 1639]|nr:DNA polymerase III subunit gamma and tau [Cryobacterium sp. 1639]MBX0300952.1 DNA polymerase III subunit gamma and tau [Cryobacterium sp. 1639]
MVTALYRRYRPETFAEMIGQSQVTDPLMTALRTNRVNHAYLFSGPRGCGKTTSARILARCLNCAEGPTDTPCGVCPSCVELSRDGSGSLDVVEIDAASHNGVDDARDIRERAIFAPARDRYKIFILDEAHMVTPQGFNALLKIVEEPPEHVKFIFATTEPEKVIGTIRSRTHHYPFRLVPPAPMLDYVQQMCDSEHMTVAPGVLPLVVRAGGGSPRDTLSLLDQLMAGTDTDAIEYERAVALLGYTHATLLDDAVDSIAARNSAAAFDAVDRVIQTGQDPRRFVEDLLERMRDLIIVGATSAAGAAAVLRGVPQDELDRMQVQASNFGPAELSRTADILNAALTEMTGATSPRLHLELMIARALIPATDDSNRGALARVERLERRIGVDGTPTDAPAPAASAAPAPRTPVAAPAPRTPAAQGAPPVATPPAATTVPPAASGWATRTPGTPAAVPVEPASAETSSPAADASPASPQADRPEPTAETPPAAPVVPVGPVTLAQIKDAWPQILEAVKDVKLSAWLVVYTARVLDLRGDDVLVLSFPSEQDMQGFKAQQAPGQGVSEFLRGAIVKVLGLRVKFIARADSETFAAAAPSAAPFPSASTTDLPASGRAAPAQQGNSSAAGPLADASAPSAPPPTSGAPTRSAPTSSAPSNSAPSNSAPSNSAPTSSASPTAASAGSAPTATPASPSGSAFGSAAPAGSSRSTSSSSTATATMAPPATASGWATVVIPGSAAALSAAETAAAEPAVSSFPGTAPAPAAPAAPARPASAAPAAPAAAQPRTSAGTASAPDGSPAVEPVRDYAPEPDFEPPFDDEPPPYDDFPPDPQQFSAPPEFDRGARPATQQSPRTQSAPGQQRAAGQDQPGQAQPGPQQARGQQSASAPAASAPAGNGQRGAPARRSPAFAEKQRYGEAVVREILGATFIEEQPHDPISRQRNDN